MDEKVTMKKSVLLCLLFLLSFSLFAGWGDFGSLVADQSSNGINQGNDAYLDSLPSDAGIRYASSEVYDYSASSSFDFSSLLSGKGWKDFSNEEKAIIKEQARDGGYQVSWENNGDMHVQDKEGTTFTMSDRWPKSGLARLLPTPSFTSGFVVTYSDEIFTVIAQGTVEEAIAYCKKVKEMGFNQDAEEVNIVSYGIYSYTALKENYEFTGSATMGALLFSLQLVDD